MNHPSDRISCPPSKQGPPEQDPPKIRIGFLGTPVFADRILQQILSLPAFEVAFVISQPDRPAGRGRRMAPPPVKETAVAHGIPVLQPQSIKKELASVLEFVAAQGPVAGAVVVAYGGLLPPQFLAAMHQRCLNVHASLLPRWRGAAPIHRAIMAGDTETGICLMQMEEGLDTGPVFSSLRIPIAPHETTGSLHDRLCDAACSLIATDLSPILSGKLDAVPQDTEGVTYAHKISREECEIDWRRAAHAIQCHVLGLSPFPGAFTWLNGSRLRILEAIVHSPDTPQGALPGQVVLSEPAATALIATGEGMITLLKVQLEGRQPMGIEEFLRGHRLLPGTMLGLITSTDGGHVQVETTSDHDLVQTKSESSRTHHDTDRSLTPCYPPGNVTQRPILSRRRRRTRNSR